MTRIIDFIRRKKYLTLFFLVLFQLLFLVRRIKSEFSETLYWDEWDARLSMNLPLKNLNWHLLWQQHNEHRIVLSKLLFFIDFMLFNGSNLPLLLANFIIATLTVLSVLKILQLSDQKNNSRVISQALYCLAIFSFSILQIENFSWGFQTQFFLSILLPVLSFLYFLRYILEKSRKAIYLSYLFSILAMGTTAGGTFTIIVILIMSIYLRRQLSEIVVNFCLAILVFSIYLYNYITAHSSVTETLLHHSSFVIKYINNYFTSPLNGLIGYKFQKLTTTLFVIMCFAVLKTSLQNYRIRKYSPNALAGLMFFLYSVLIAFASAAGRFQFGVDQANASRYTTISLFGWFGALLVILDSDEDKKVWQFSWATVAILVTSLFLPYQISNSEPNSDTKMQRNLAAVSLLEGVYDDSIYKVLYPDPKRLEILANPLIRDGKSIFDSEFKSRFQIGSYRKPTTTNLPKCIGSLELVRRTSDESGYVISGWIASGNMRADSFELLATDANYHLLGAGFSGYERIDMAIKMGSWARKAGFNLVSLKIPDHIYYFGNSEFKCELKTT